jgi:hypothetical protein
MEIGKNVFVYLTQLTDHILGKKKNVVHRSRNCIFCVQKSNHFLGENRRIALVPAFFPSDVDYEHWKYSGNLVPKLAFWMTTNIHFPQKQYEKEIFIMLQATGYRLQHNVSTLNGVKVLFVHVDYFPAHQAIVPRLYHYANQTVVITLKKFYPIWASYIRAVIVLLDDLTCLRTLHMILTTRILRCTVHQLRTTLETHSYGIQLIIPPNCPENQSFLF